MDVPTSGIERIMTTLVAWLQRCSQGEQVGDTLQDTRDAMDGVQSFCQLADYTMKSTLVQTLGVFPMLARILEAAVKAKAQLPATTLRQRRGISSPLVSPLFDEVSDQAYTTLTDLQATLAGTVWSLCIGHPPNKEKANIFIPSLVGLIKHETDKKILAHAASALWSICYGVEENQRLALTEGAAPLLVRLLRTDTARVIRAATGALWHLSSLPDARKPILEAGGLWALIRALALAETAALEMGEDEDDREGQTLQGCLALANICMCPDTDAHSVEQSCALLQIRRFVLKRDCTRYTMHNLVWTTLKPLVDLLEARHEEINELGCFLIACLSRTNQQTAKLFHEGAMETLEKLVLRRDQPTVRRLARFVLVNLGMAKEEEEVNKEEKEKDVVKEKVKEEDAGGIWSLLRSLGLERYADAFESQQVTRDNIVHLNEKDLEHGLGVTTLGPRRQLLAYIASLRQHQQHVEQQQPIRITPSATPPTSACLICCEADRSVCFVLCGHVVTCQGCARILMARSDPCIICRAPIVQTVVPFYL